MAEVATQEDRVRGTKSKVASFGGSLYRAIKSTDDPRVGITFDRSMDRFVAAPSGLWSRVVVNFLQEFIYKSQLNGSLCAVDG